MIDSWIPHSDRDVVVDRRNRDRPGELRREKERERATIENFRFRGSKLDEQPFYSVRLRQKARTTVSEQQARETSGLCILEGFRLHRNNKLLADKYRGLVRRLLHIGANLVNGVES